MVAGYHLIWTAYGCWLPNDPRGSTSTVVNSPLLTDLGTLHYGRKRVQPARKVVREFYQQAAGNLRHELLRFTEDDVAAIGAAFGRVMRSRNYTCYACAIMPDHVHLLIRKHRDLAETMIDALQDASWAAVLERHARAPTHPVWSVGGRAEYLETRRDFTRTIRYIELNPEKIGLPRQRWDFVSAYQGWLPGLRS